MDVFYQRPLNSWNNKSWMFCSRTTRKSWCSQFCKFFFGQKQFVLTQFTHQITWTVFTVHTFKNSETERWMIISKTCSLICAVGENCGTLRPKPIWCRNGTFWKLQFFVTLQCIFELLVVYLHSFNLGITYIVHFTRRYNTKAQSFYENIVY